ncbi:Vga family ABC-F type ribosomal protection protein [Robertmurraya andreesenii]|uniref:Pleuromutilin/lincosamide/streptogramin A transport system ATP-binding/permease protein n=1 Tax=Anoxybacillus andreesenii TaxID=1325932 RepID=A0ABT9V435_9BACL|nr:Vga family ABC-F type ribosomal protection protein [Robertmurraya andreesenii]MDQ0155701.1 pleuromutilin/lincosamide/streptogramin A transport system ATP-binding/permease protein [Robertmurraya andreesenii]
MLLLDAQNVKLYIKDRLLFDLERLQIHSGARIGLVGKNGSGKTSLLEVLTGQRTCDSGTIHTYGICELLPQLKKKDSTKSGGEITQEYIVDALTRNPELLLADEPTTHLDTAHIEWLEKKLGNWQGALLIVSHDREFLDALCTTIWELQDGRIKEYIGNYSDYVRQKELETKSHEAAYEKYEKKKKQLEEALILKEKKAARATKSPKKVSPSEARITGAKPYFAKKQKKLQKTVKAIETRIEKLEKVEKIRDTPALQMDLPNEETFKGKIVLRAEKIEGHVGQRTLWSKVSFLVRGGDKLAIIGPNGSGKTTLLKKIIHQTEGITLSPAMKFGYFSQTIDQLNTSKSILENVQETSKQTETFIRIVLARLHFFREDVYKKVGVLSGGERVKVALAKLFVSDINTLILDEPTNFLDIEAVEALESLLLEYSGTILFVSHDRRFISNIATRILIIEDERIHLFEGTYNEYKNYTPAIERNSAEDEKLLIETKISEVLSRLSIEPTEELEKEFQQLLKKKRALENRS